MKPLGGFRHEPKNLFERLIHHKWAFPVISVFGGLVLVVAIFAGQSNFNQNSSSAVRPLGSAVRGGTAPSEITTPGANDTPQAATTTATPGPQRSFSQAPQFTIDPTASYTATISTAKGDIVIKLDARAAPQTVNNFVFLAQNHFYDGLSFQRVVPGFIAQAGSPTADGRGGPGYTIPDENSPLKHDAGAVAMAEGASPNTAGSQFYVALASLNQQNLKDTVFGQVTSGLDLLLQQSARDPAVPNQPAPLAITTVTITKQ